ncbi:MAG: CoA-binding protein, partial [Candidatus Micrarchaeota archaeon]
MQEIGQILEEAEVIAVVGLSDNPDRPSFQVASYLLGHGYKI